MVTNNDEYQVLPQLSDEEYSALKSDIRENGVREPIHIDENGNILDGHHRYKICEELDIEDYPKEVHKELSEKEKRTFAYKSNLQRRHLEQGQKKELTKQYLLNDWDYEETQRSIAQKLGVSQKTVSNAKQELVSRGKLSNLTELSKAEKEEKVGEIYALNPDMSYRKIADKVDFDVTHTTVRNWLENKVRYTVKFGEIERGFITTEEKHESLKKKAHSEGMNPAEYLLEEAYLPTLREIV